MKNIEKFQKRLKENIKTKENKKKKIYEINSKIKKDEKAKNEYLKEKEFQNFALNLLTKIIFEKKKKKLGILKTEKTVKEYNKKKTPIIINYDFIFIPDIKTLKYYNKKKKLLQKKYSLNPISHSFFFSNSENKNFVEKKKKKIKNIEIIIPKFKNYEFNKKSENKFFNEKTISGKFFEKKQLGNFYENKKMGIN